MPRSAPSPPCLVEPSRVSCSAADNSVRSAGRPAHSEGSWGRFAADTAAGPAGCYPADRETASEAPGSVAPGSGTAVDPDSFAGPADPPDGAHCLPTVRVAEDSW